MANQTQLINTRIKNKVDLLGNWTSNSAQTLLDGEIAIVRVPTGETYVNPVTNKEEPVVELLMKVGDGENAFVDLPWLSAKASDVYNWAKNQYAKDIPVAVIKGSGEAATTETATLGAWLKTVYDAGVTNAANISANTSAIEILNGNNTKAGSVAKAIKDAIDALDNTTSGTGTFVKAVTQTDGKVAVTYGTISETELPSISTSKIVVTAKTGSMTKDETLDERLSTIDGDIVDLKARQVGHTDAQINTLIDNKINALDAATEQGSGNFVTGVSQTNGIITVTKGNLPTASATTEGIVKLGATGGAATYDSVFGTNGLESRVEANEGEIADIKSTIAGGTHFRGEVANAPTGSTYTLKNTTDAKTAVVGDIVICGEKEYIYVAASSWKELGDLGRVATLETWRTNLVKEDTAVAGQFVTEVDIAEDGTVTVNRAQPDATQVKYGTSSTVGAALASHDVEVAKLSDIGSHKTVGAVIDSKINTELKKLTQTDSGSGDFVTNVTQANGVVTVTKGNLPDASTSAKGIVKLNNTTTSESTTEAATANAVKSAYDAGTEAQGRVADVESNYVKVVDNKLFVGKSGTLEIIFDCGGAAGWTTTAE